MMLRRAKGVATHPGVLPIPGSGNTRMALAAAALAACALAVVPGAIQEQAAATNWFGASGKYGQCTGGNRTDAMPQTYFYEDLTSKTRDMATWVRVNRINPRPLLSTSLQSTADYNTDVHVFDRYYTDYCGVDWWQANDNGGVIGFATCNYLTNTGSNRCESADTRFDLNYLSGKDDWVYQHYICHEFGHTLGLAHPDTTAEGLGQGCMSAGDGKTDYSSHDKTHLDSTSNY